MSEQLTKDLIESVKKNLPAMVADQMLTFIEEAKEDKRAIASLQKDLEKKEKLWEANKEEYLRKIHELELRVLARDELEKREIAVAETEKAQEKERNRLDAWKAEQNFITEQRVTSSMMEMFRTVFKNPTVRTTIRKDVVTPPAGGATYPSVNQVNEEHTRDEL